MPFGRFGGRARGGFRLPAQALEVGPPERFALHDLYALSDRDVRADDGDPPGFLASVRRAAQALTR